MGTVKQDVIAILRAYQAQNQKVTPELIEMFKAKLLSREAEEVLPFLEGREWDGVAAALQAIVREVQAEDARDLTKKSSYEALADELRNKLASGLQLSSYMKEKALEEELNAKKEKLDSLSSSEDQLNQPQLLSLTASVNVLTQSLEGIKSATDKSSLEKQIRRLEAEVAREALQEGSNITDNPLFNRARTLTRNDSEETLVGEKRENHDPNLTLVRKRKPKEEDSHDPNLTLVRRRKPKEEDASKNTFPAAIYSIIEEQTTAILNLVKKSPKDQPYGNFDLEKIDLPTYDAILQKMASAFNALNELAKTEQKNADKIVSDINALWKEKSEILNPSRMDGADYTKGHAFLGIIEQVNSTLLGAFGIQKKVEKEINIPVYPTKINIKAVWSNRNRRYDYEALKAQPIVDPENIQSVANFWNDLTKQLTEKQASVEREKGVDKFVAASPEHVDRFLGGDLLTPDKINVVEKSDEEIEKNIREQQDKARKSIDAEPDLEQKKAANPMEASGKRLLDNLAEKENHFYNTLKYKNSGLSDIRGSLIDYVAAYQAAKEFILDNSTQSVFKEAVNYFSGETSLKTGVPQIFGEPRTADLPNIIKLLKKRVGSERKNLTHKDLLNFLTGVVESIPASNQGRNVKKEAEGFQQQVRKKMEVEKRNLIHPGVANKNTMIESRSVGAEPDAARLGGSATGKGQTADSKGIDNADLASEEAALQEAARGSAAESEDDVRAILDEIEEWLKEVSVPEEAIITEDPEYLSKPASNEATTKPAETAEPKSVLPEAPSREDENTIPTELKSAEPKPVAPGSTQAADQSGSRRAQRSTTSKRSDSTKPQDQEPSTENNFVTRIRSGIKNLFKNKKNDAPSFDTREKSSGTPSMSKPRKDSAIESKPEKEPLKKLSLKEKIINDLLSELEASRQALIKSSKKLDASGDGKEYLANFATHLSQYQLLKELLVSDSQKYKQIIVDTKADDPIRDIFVNCLIFTGKSRDAFFEQLSNEYRTTREKSIKQGAQNDWFSKVPPLVESVPQALVRRISIEIKSVGEKPEFNPALPRMVAMLLGEIINAPNIDLTQALAEKAASLSNLHRINQLAAFFGIQPLPNNPSKDEQLHFLVRLGAKVTEGEERFYKLVAMFNNVGQTDLKTLKQKMAEAEEKLNREIEEKNRELRQRYESLRNDGVKPENLPASSEGELPFANLNDAELESILEDSIDEEVLGYQSSDEGSEGENEEELPDNPLKTIRGYKAPLEDEVMQQFGEMTARRYVEVMRSDVEDKYKKLAQLAAFNRIASQYGDDDPDFKAGKQAFFGSSNASEQDFWFLHAEDDSDLSNSNKAKATVLERILEKTVSAEDKKIFTDEYNAVIDRYNEANTFNDFFNPYREQQVEKTDIIAFWNREKESVNGQLLHTPNIVKLIAGLMLAAEGKSPAEDKNSVDRVIDTILPELFLPQGIDINKDNTKSLVDLSKKLNKVVEDLFKNFYNGEIEKSQKANVNKSAVEKANASQKLEENLLKALEGYRNSVDKKMGAYSKEWGISSDKVANIVAKFHGKRARFNEESLLETENRPSEEIAESPVVESEDSTPTQDYRKHLEDVASALIVKVRTLRTALESSLTDENDENIIKLLVDYIEQYGITKGFCKQYGFTHEEIADKGICQRIASAIAGKWNLNERRVNQDNFVTTMYDLIKEFTAPEAPEEDWDEAVERTREQHLKELENEPVTEGIRELLDEPDDDVIRAAPRTAEPVEVVIRTSHPEAINDMFKEHIMQLATCGFAEQDLWMQITKILKNASPKEREKILSNITEKLQKERSPAALPAPIAPDSSFILAMKAVSIELEPSVKKTEARLEAVIKNLIWVNQVKQEGFLAIKREMDSKGFTHVDEIKDFKKNIADYQGLLQDEEGEPVKPGQATENQVLKDLDEIIKASPRWDQSINDTALDKPNLAKVLLEKHNLANSLLEDLAHQITLDLDDSEMEFDFEFDWSNSDDRSQAIAHYKKKGSPQKALLIERAYQQYRLENEIRNTSARTVIIGTGEKNPNTPEGRATEALYILAKDKIEQAYDRAQQECTEHSRHPGKKPVVIADFILSNRKENNIMGSKPKEEKVVVIEGCDKLPKLLMGKEGNKIGQALHDEIHFTKEIENKEKLKIIHCLQKHVSTSWFGKADSFEFTFKKQGKTFVLMVNDKPIPEKALRAIKFDTPASGGVDNAYDWLQRKMTVVSARLMAMDGSYFVADLTGIKTEEMKPNRIESDTDEDNATLVATAEEQAIEANFEEWADKDYLMPDVKVPPSAKASFRI